MEGMSAPSIAEKIDQFYDLIAEPVDRGYFVLNPDKLSAIHADIKAIERNSILCKAAVGASLICIVVNPFFKVPVMVAAVANLSWLYFLKQWIDLHPVLASYAYPHGELSKKIISYREDTFSEFHQIAKSIIQANSTTEDAKEGTLLDEFSEIGQKNSAIFRQNIIKMDGILKRESATLSREYQKAKQVHAEVMPYILRFFKWWNGELVSIANGLREEATYTQALAKRHIQLSQLTQETKESIVPKEQKEFAKILEEYHALGNGTIVDHDLDNKQRRIDEMHEKLVDLKKNHPEIELSVPERYNFIEPVFQALVEDMCKAAKSETDDQEHLEKVYQKLVNYADKHPEFNERSSVEMWRIWWANRHGSGKEKQHFDYLTFSMTNLSKKLGMPTNRVTVFHDQPMRKEFLSLCQNYQSFIGKCVCSKEKPSRDVEWFIEDAYKRLVAFAKQHSFEVEVPKKVEWEGIVELWKEEQEKLRKERQSFNLSLARFSTMQYYDSCI